jgi:hypothetical protein
VKYGDLTFKAIVAQLAEDKRREAAMMTPEQVLIQIEREHPDFYEKYVIKGIVFYTPTGIAKLDMWGRAIPPGVGMRAECEYCREFIPIREHSAHSRECRSRLWNPHR